MHNLCTTKFSEIPILAKTCISAYISYAHPFSPHAEICMSCTNQNFHTLTFPPPTPRHNCSQPPSFPLFSASLLHFPIFLPTKTLISPLFLLFSSSLLHSYHHRPLPWKLLPLPLKALLSKLLPLLCKPPILISLHYKPLHLLNHLPTKGESGPR